MEPQFNISGAAMQIPSQMYPASTSHIIRRTQVCQSILSRLHVGYITLSLLILRRYADLQNGEHTVSIWFRDTCRIYDADLIYSDVCEGAQGAIWE